MSDVVAVDPVCWEALRIPQAKLRYLTNSAHGVTPAGHLLFDRRHAFYRENPDLFAGCTGPAPTDAAVAAVRAMEPAPVVSVPYADWPTWAKLVAKRRRDGEAGIGDTFERIASSVGGKRFEAWATRRGINCGCKARRAKWNRQYPYGT